MSMHDWNEHYLRGELPWDTRVAEPLLVEFMRSGAIARGSRVLEIGSGTGTNAVWLAEQGFNVLGVDISERAVQMAREKAAGVAGAAFAVSDFLTDTLTGPFDFVFDRGTFHVFDEADARARFAGRVAALLRPEGSWLSLIGSTEGPARETGPPRRSARDIVSAIEPELEIVSLRDAHFHLDMPDPPRAWACVSRRRTVPAQPSTRLA